MSVDLLGLILFFLAIGLLAIGIFFADEIFPNALITWSLRIIGLFIIIGIIALYRWKKSRNL